MNPEKEDKAIDAIVSFAFLMASSAVLVADMFAFAYTASRCAQGFAWWIIPAFVTEALVAMYSLVFVYAVFKRYKREGGK